MGNLEGSGGYEEPDIQVKIILKWLVIKLSKELAVITWLKDREK